MTFAATILTLYPDMFPGPLGHSLAGRALAEGTWTLDTVQIRDFATDKHRTVDDTPAGGGAGMVLKVDVLARAIDHARALHPQAPVVAMTPRGRPLTQARVRDLAAGPVSLPNHNRIRSILENAATAIFSRRLGLSNRNSRRN